MSVTGDDLLVISYLNDMHEKENLKQLFAKNFPGTISQTNSLFRQSQHKRKIRDKNKFKGILDKCSDLACTKKYALNTSAY